MWGSGWRVGGWEGGAVVGGSCRQLWLILMVWVYPAGGATVSQEEKGSQAE